MSTTEEDVVAGTGEDLPVAESDPEARRAAEQNRIDNEFAQAASDRARVQQEAAALLDRATQRFEEASKPKQSVEEDKPPVRGDEPYEEYLEKVLDYHNRETKRHVDRQVQSALAMQREDSEHVLANSKAREAARRGADLYTGFDDAVNKIPVMPPAAVIACAELPEPEHVLHYLGTHTEEARKIGRMTPVRVAHAILALAERLDQERVAKKDGKPAEPAEFGPKPGGKTAPSGPSANMPMDQWANARIQEKLRLMKG